MVITLSLSLIHPILQYRATLFTLCPSFRLLSTFISYNPYDSLLLNNLDDGTHPFHLHGHKFWVMAQGDGNYNSSVQLDPAPVFRDTVSVGKSTLVPPNCQ